VSELNRLLEDALAAIAAADELAGLEQLRVQYLGKKGEITLQLKRKPRGTPRATAARRTGGPSGR